MISTKEAVTVRLEVDFEILAGELRTLEEDTKRLTLQKILEVWEPEKRGSRFMLRLIDLEEKEDESESKKKVD